MSTLPDRYGCWSSINGHEGRRDRFREGTKMPYALPPEEGSPAEKAPQEGPNFYAKVRRNVDGTFSKFPYYKEDPWDLKIQAARERAAAIRLLKTTVGAKPFKSTGGDRDYRLSKDATTAFRPMASTSIVFRPVSGLAFKK